VFTCSSVGVYNKEMLVRGGKVAQDKAVGCCELGFVDRRVPVELNRQFYLLCIVAGIPGGWEELACINVIVRGVVGDL